ncbi:MAG: hypothetical protein R3F43_01735 [bacterium]
MVGLTIVAAGTSMPELVVSLQAALRGSPDLAVGNVVGSNIFNVAAILGIAALIHPLRIEGNTVRLEWPVMFLASFQLVLLARDGVVDRLGGRVPAGRDGGLHGLCGLDRPPQRPTRREGRLRRDDHRVVRAHRPGGPGFNAVAILAGVGLLIGGERPRQRRGRSGPRLRRLGGHGGAHGRGGGHQLARAGRLDDGASAGSGRHRRRQRRRLQHLQHPGILGPTALVTPTAVTGEIIHRDLWWMLGSAVLLFP